MDGDDDVDADGHDAVRTEMIVGKATTIMIAELMMMKTLMLTMT